MIVTVSSTKVSARAPGAYSDSDDLEMGRAGKTHEQPRGNPLPVEHQHAGRLREIPVKPSVRRVEWRAQYQWRSGAYAPAATEAGTPRSGRDFATRINALVAGPRAIAGGIATLAASALASEGAYVRGVDSLHRLAASRSKLPLRQRNLTTTVSESLRNPTQTLKALPGALYAWIGTAGETALGALGSTAAALFSANPDAVDHVLLKMQKSLISSNFRSMTAHVHPSDLLQHMASERADPVQSFWSDSDLSAALGRPAPALLASLDALSLGDETRLTALALSLAFRGTKETPREEAVEMGALAWLCDAKLVENATVQVEDGPYSSAALVPGADRQSENLALKVLGRAAFSNQFSDMLRLLGHDVGDGDLDEQTRAQKSKIFMLRTMMQAYAAQCGIAPVTRAQRRSPSTEANEGGSLQAEFERSVLHACVRRLKDAEAVLSPEQQANLWIWQNGFRDVSARSNVIAQLAVLADIYGAGDDALSPLAAGHFGLGGADYRTLTEEAADLEQIPATPVIGALVQALRARIHDRLASIGDEEGAAGADAERARLVAQAVALEVWLPQQRADRGFELNDIVNGRTFDLSNSNTIEARQIHQWCADALAAARPATGGGMSSATEGHDARRLAALRARAAKALVDEHMNLLRLGELAAEHGICDRDLVDHHGQADVPSLADVMSKARGVIEGINTRPNGIGTDEVVELLRRFCAGAPSGNNVTLARDMKFGVRADGGALNVASYAGLSDAGHRSLLVRPKGAVERTVTTEVHVGMATHGGQLIAGKRTVTTRTLGAGAQYGRSAGPDDHTGLGRVAGGADVGPYAVEESAFTGVALRLLRRVVKMELQASPPIFEQNDADLRKGMAELQLKLRSLAREVKEKRERALANNEPYEQGEDMLRGLAGEALRMGLSIGLVRQKATSKRADVTLAAGVSVTTSQQDGMRIGAGGSLAFERVSSTFEHAEEGGTANVASRREGVYVQAKSGASAGVNGFIGPGGLPPTELAGRNQLLGSIGWNAKARWVRSEEGKLEPRLCFSDAGFPDFDSYARYLESRRDDWVEAFKYKHGGDTQAAAAELDEHLRRVRDTRVTSHVHDARSRLNKTFADQLNRLIGLLDVTPRTTGTMKFVAELERACMFLAEAAEATRLVSGITYAPLEESEGTGQSVGGGRWASGLRRRAEREIRFDPPGWAAMQIGEDEVSAYVDPSGRIVPRAPLSEVAG